MGTAVQRRSALDGTIKDLLKHSEAEIAQVIRGPIGAGVLIRAALLQVNMTPALMKVAGTRDGKLSILQAVSQAASLGLMVGGPAGEAALVPYKGVAKLLPMVRGLATLAIRSGAILRIQPRAVYEGDRFEVHLGSRDEIVHEPDLAGPRNDDSLIQAFYTVTTYPNGVKAIGEPMMRDEIERVRSVSRAKDEGPWVDHWGEMGKKTVVKRDTKLLPMSPEFRAAVELDNRFETGRINEPSDLLDTAEEVEAHVVAETRAKTDALRKRLDPEEAAEIDRQAAMDRE